MSASEELVVGLGQVRYILKSIANGDDQRDAAAKAAEIVETAMITLSVLQEDGEVEAKVMSYEHAHETAVELGYPSLTEALEDLERLKSAALKEQSHGDER